MFMPASEFCGCEQREPSHDPRRSPDFCGHCGKRFPNPEWDQSDENFIQFWERIEASYPGWQHPLYEPPDEQQTLRLQTTHRELAGREHFGYAYLGRDNIAEAREEIADCLMYLYLDTLKCRREDTDPEWDVVLEIADDLLSAYGKLNQLRHKHRGVPA